MPYRILLFCFVVLVGSSPTTHSGELLTPTNEYKHELYYRSQNHMRFHNGAFFTRDLEKTDDIRNWSYYLAEINARTGRKERLMRTKRDAPPPTFVLDDYIILTWEGLVVYRKKDMAKLGSRRLRDPIYDAFAEDDILFLLQRSQERIVLSRFKLPDIEFIDEIPVEISRKLVSFLDGDIVGIRSRRCETGRQCRSFVRLNRDLDVLSSVPFEVKRQGSGGCQTTFKRITQDKVILQPSCSDYIAIDLKQEKVLYRLPPPPTTYWYDIAATDEFLFARALEPAPTVWDIPNHAPVAIHDLESGQQLAKAMLPDGWLFATDNALLINRALQGPQLDVVVYSVNAELIRDRQRQEADIESAHARALQADDPVTAVGILEATSLLAAVEGDTDTPYSALNELGLDYARLLTLLPTRVAEGLALIEQIAAKPQSPEHLPTIIEQADVRASIFDLDDVRREQALSEHWAKADDRPLRQATSLIADIDYRLALNQILLHQDRVYIACYTCLEDGWTGIRVFDRENWEQLATIKIVEDDGEKQPGIRGLAIVGDRLFVTISRRFSGDNNTELHEVDLNSYKVVEVRAVPGHAQRLVGGENRLHLCGFHTENCTALDLETFSPVASDLYAPHATAASTFAVTPLSEAAIGNLRRDVGQVRQVSSRFIVSSEGRLGQHTFRFYPKEPAQEPLVFPLKIPGHSELHFGDDDEFVVVIQRIRDRLRLHRFSLETGELKTLTEFVVRDHSDFRGGASDGRTLFLAFRNQLVAIDMKSAAIHDWASVASDDDRRNVRKRTAGLDKPFVDGNRLIALSTTGQVSIIELERFYALSKSDETPYATTAAALDPR